MDTAMFTASINGEDLRQVVPYASGVSHFDWQSPVDMLATFRVDNTIMNHVSFKDGRADYRIIGAEILEGDGHCTFSPGKKWFATDRNHADTLEKSLWIYNIKSNDYLKIGQMPMFEKKYLGGDLRCDLHPRWNRKGNQLCFDALDSRTRTRQLHVAYIDF
ncbi:MAG: hypothetical protein H7Y03_12380 [Chitinophagaceae bacterium]|nr:hypothetical protein [Chitinophagaceae bacterium]